MDTIITLLVIAGLLLIYLLFIRKDKDERLAKRGQIRKKKR